MSTSTNASKAPAPAVSDLQRQLAESEKRHVEQQQAKVLLEAQRDLAIRLSSSGSLDAALSHCLDAAMVIGGVDCGGAYAVDSKSGCGRLVVHRGLPEECVRAVSEYPPDSELVALLHRGVAVYTQHSEVADGEPNGVRAQLGLRAVGIVPIVHGQELVGALHVGSRSGDEIPAHAQHALETLAAQIGGVLARIRADEAMRERESPRRDLERLLRELTTELEHANEKLRREIADRAKVDSALRLSEAQLRAVVESLPFEFFLLDESGRYVMHNSKFERRWGDVVQRTPEEVAPDSATLAVWQEMNTRAFAGEMIEQEITMDAGHGTEYVHGIVAPVWDEGRVKAILGVGVDISDRVHAEKEAKLLEARLREAHKLEAVGTLAGGVAHAFNNILMAVLGHVSLMLDDLPASHAHRDGLEEIEQQVRHAAELTSQLLGYARKGKYEVRPLDLNQLVGAVSETFARARRELIVECHLAEGQLVVDADQGQIEQVLLNLFLNAADAMPHGGHLTLRTFRMSHDEMPAQPDAVLPGDYVVVSVRDEGVGISSDHREHIFEPFFTTKVVGEGTGLGLASVYGILKSHGGHIDVESEVGRGTTFTAYLPASDAMPTQAPRERDHVAHGRVTILIVDDEMAVVEVGARMLERLGFNVLTATCGEEAVKAYEARRDTIDLVVLDMVMPGMGGGEVFDRLRAIDPQVKVVLSSGFSMNDRAREILDRGCNGFIQKPFDLNELSRQVREVL